MKKLIIASLLFAILFSCEKKDDTDPIVGTYKITNYSSLNCTNPAFSFDLDYNNSNCDTSNGIEYCESGTINISSEGNLTSTIRLFAPAFGTLFSLNGTGTYVKNGNTATICLPGCIDMAFNGRNKLTYSTLSNGCTVTLEFSKI